MQKIKNKQKNLKNNAFYEGNIKKMLNIYNKQKNKESSSSILFKKIKES